MHGQVYFCLDTLVNNMPVSGFPTYADGAGTHHNFQMANAFVSSAVGATSITPVPAAAAHSNMNQTTIAQLRH